MTTKKLNRMLISTHTQVALEGQNELAYKERRLVCRFCTIMYFFRGEGGGLLYQGRVLKKCSQSSEIVKLCFFYCLLFCIVRPP